MHDLAERIPLLARQNYPFIRPLRHLTSNAKTQENDVPLMLAVTLAAVCLGWYIAVICVCLLGSVQLYRNYRAPKRLAAVEQLPLDEVPHVTIIRPVRGLEPALYECLASTFRLSYPSTRLTIYLCVASRTDPALATLQKLLSDFPTVDARIFVEDEDSAVYSDRMGPNPKIRNMSRAYREAKGDIIWIMDCNVWVARGVGGRMVDTLCGFTLHGRSKQFKLVHQLPLVVDITSTSSLLGDQAATSNSAGATTFDPHALAQMGNTEFSLRIGGGRLEEQFLASAHAKFYTAINFVRVAPCIVGKSSMFRRSHLDSLTSTDPDARGLNYFSQNICEDHLIGDLLWKKQTPEEETGAEFGKHQMVYGDLAVQPMAGMSVSEYLARRVRWLRVRKFTVTLATFVEPGTESFLCTAYGAFAVTTLPWFAEGLYIPPTWVSFFLFWLLGVASWAALDWSLYNILHSMASIEADGDTPSFVTPPRLGGKTRRRPFGQWLLAWLGREALALPIWLWAFYGGATVAWRGQRFRVGIDMKVHALDPPDRLSSWSGRAAVAAPSSRSTTPGKSRRE